MTSTRERLAEDIRSVAIAPQKDQLQISSVLTDLMPHFRRWAPRFAYAMATTSIADEQDATSLCAMHTFEMLHICHEDSVADWYGYLYGSCKYKVLAHFESASVTVASGMTERMRKRRSEDTGEDLTAFALAEYDEPVRADPGFVLSSVEGRELVQVIIEVCAERSAELGRVAAQWIGSAYSEPPVIANGAVIGHELGMTTKRACTLLARIRQIAREVCLTEFGIDSPF